MTSSHEHPALLTFKRSRQTIPLTVFSNAMKAPVESKARFVIVGLSKQPMRCLAVKADVGTFRPPIDPIPSEGCRGERRWEGFKRGVALGLQNWSALIHCSCGRLIQAKTFSGFRHRQDATGRGLASLDNCIVASTYLLGEGTPSPTCALRR